MRSRVPGVKPVMATPAARAHFGKEASGGQALPTLIESARLVSPSTDLGTKADWLPGKPARQRSPKRGEGYSES